MKKIFLLIALAGLFLSSCVTADPQRTYLDQRVAKLERQIAQMQMAGATGAGANIYPVTGALTGGGTGALDKITSTADKDAAIVMFNAEATYGNAFMPFTLDQAGGCGTESAPTCIESGDAGEWWELADLYGTDVYSYGQIWGRIPLTSDADGKTLSMADLRGSLQIAAGAGTWTIPDVDAAAGTGWSFCVHVPTAVEVVIAGDAEDKFRLGTTLTAAGADITNNTAEAVNDFICLVLTDFDSNIAIWSRFGYAGTWTVVP